MQFDSADRLREHRILYGTNGLFVDSQYCSNCGKIFWTRGHARSALDQLLKKGIATVEETAHVSRGERNALDFYMSWRNINGEDIRVSKLAIMLCSIIGNEWLQITDASIGRARDGRKPFTTTIVLNPDTPDEVMAKALSSIAEEGARWGECYCPCCRTKVDTREYLSKKENEQKAYSVCQEISKEYVSNSKSITADFDAMDNSKKVNAQVFLTHLLNLEKDIHFLEGVLANAIRKQRESFQQKETFTNMIEKIQKAREERNRSAWSERMKAIENEISDIPERIPLLDENVIDVKIQSPVPRVPVLKKLGLFKRAQIQAENDALMQDYHQKKERYQMEYQQAVEKEKQRIRKQNEELMAQRLKEEQRLQKVLENLSVESSIVPERKAVPNPYISLHQWNESEVQTIKDKISELCVARAKLLRMNVVHPKYWDIIALSTILEYFVVGRCTELTGTDGAYNLYENEIRANRIITQLDNVIDSLDQIKKMQYRTYEVMKDIQDGTKAISEKLDIAVSSLTKISEDTGAIRETAELIAYNTEKTAHYAKINANLTDALGYLVALN